MHKIREEVLNTSLADVLYSHSKIENHPESMQLTVSGRLRVPDITIYPIKGSRRHIRLESKLGTDEYSKSAAVRQAASHLSPGSAGMVFGCIALCYPQEFAESRNPKELRELLTKTDELIFAGVSSRQSNNSSDVIWQTGTLDQLADLIRQMESGDVGLVDSLSQRVKIIASFFPSSEELSEDIADALKLSSNASPGSFHIAALIILNAAMLQIRLRTAGKIRGGGRHQNSRYKEGNPRRKPAFYFIESMGINLKN